MFGTGAHVLLATPAASGAPVQVAGVAVMRGDSGSVGETETETETGTDAVAGSVVTLHASGCGVSRQGSGVLVRGGDGSVQLLTNAHVVAGATTVRAVLADAGETELAVLGAVHGRDAARIDPEGLLAAGARPLDVGEQADPGDPVSVVGYPAGEFSAVTAAVQDAQLRAGYGAAVEVLLVGSQARGGHSGGAVLDASGSLVGLVAARDPGSGRVVAYRIGDLLDEALDGLPAC
ncbi:MAG: serine protease [Microthrixaceae bacterium]